jgi:methionyl-tRNA synthetase
VPDPIKRYLLLPMQPTPNGRLHIGHAAGPYLRADVVARHLRRQGHDVSVISGSDVYENWILLDSRDRACAPAETCWRFHHLIGDDLRGLNVELDDWVCPLDDAHAGHYREVHEALLSSLSRSGTARKVRERLPRAAESGRYVIGVWLLGNCPHCRQPSGGNSCEHCGYHFQPSEILEPRSRLDEGPLAWEDFESWFLSPEQVDTVISKVRAADVSPAFAEIAIRYLREARGAVRLSQPSDWGIQSEWAGRGGVLSNPYFVYCLYCAEVYRRMRQDEWSAFDRRSDVITVGLFGIDNAVGGVAASHALAQAQGELESFDHMVTNYFLDFEGKKCSTSRKHGIWLGELFRSTSVSADELRYSLAGKALERGSDNFSLSEFVDAVNELRGFVEAVEGVAPHNGGLSGSAARDVHDAVREQGQHLDPGRAFSLVEARAVLDGWMRRGAQSDVGWQTGLALLAEPIMPVLAKRVWERLGHTGRPGLAALEASARPVGLATRSVARRRLDPADMRRVSHLGSNHATQ